MKPEHVIGQTLSAGGTANEEKIAFYREEPKRSVLLDGFVTFLLTALTLTLIYPLPAPTQSRTYEGYAYVVEWEDGDDFAIDSYSTMASCKKFYASLIRRIADEAQPAKVSQCARGTFYLQPVPNGRPVYLNVLTADNELFLMQAQRTLAGCQGTVSLNQESAKRARDTQTQQSGCRPAWFAWD